MVDFNRFCWNEYPISYIRQKSSTAMIIITLLIRALPTACLALWSSVYIPYYVCKEQCSNAAVVARCRLLTLFSLLMFYFHPAAQSGRPGRQRGGGSLVYPFINININGHFGIFSITHVTWLGFQCLSSPVLWCSGYHICLTRRRSWVRNSPEPA